MRIVISSPPKMGNKWAKCLLSRIYDLQWIIGDDSPDTNIAKFSQFVGEGKFPDNSIFHQHCRYKPKLCDIIDEIPAHLVTIVRDVIRSVEKVVAAPLPVKEEPRRAGDPPILVAKADRVRSTLGWKPRLDDLDTIVRHALEWERKLQGSPW